jgi:hypothetical protein
MDLQSRFPLLGYNRERWERRKAEFRARLAKEHAAPKEAVKTRQQIEAENVSYWTCGGMSFWRRKYAEEAEEARERWAQLDPNGPNGATRSRRAAKCNTSEGKDSGPLKCNTVTGQERTCRNCGKSFQATRSDASFCSAICRVKASRVRRPK